MNNEFQKLFQIVIALWPESLNTSEKILHRSGGASIPLLTSVHDDVLQKIEVFSDNVLLIHMDWAIYTALHQTARINDQIEPRKVNAEVVRAIFERNLALDDSDTNKQ